MVRPENAYLFDDEGLPEVSGLGSAGEGFFKEDESEITADPLGLCCETRHLGGLEREPRSYSEVLKGPSRDALAWAKKTREELARREAELLNSKFGPNLFKFGEVPKVSPTEPGFWCVNEYVNSDRSGASEKSGESDAGTPDFPGQAE